MSAKKREASPSNGVPDDRVPVGWISVPLREVITPSSLKVEPKDASDQPYVGLEHIEAQTTRLLGHGRARDVRSTKSVFREGDVLYGKLRPYLSKVCLAPFDGIASTDILVFPKVPYVPSDYLMRFLSQTQVAEFANQHSAGTQLPESASPLSENCLSRCHRLSNNGGSWTFWRRFSEGSILVGIGSNGFPESSRDSARQCLQQRAPED